MRWHPLHTDFSLPERLNCPFCYEPHPVARQAAERLQALLPEPGEGKMFGVLVAEDGEGRLGWLAAYSGQVEGLVEAEFVPPVFDYLQPDGYFRTHEADITALNHRIAALEASPRRTEAQAALRSESDAFDALLAQRRSEMAEAKRRRDGRRAAGALTTEEEAELIRESQFQKAELHRMKKAWQARLAELQSAADACEKEIERLKEKRKKLSDTLQRWLFSEFCVADSHGRLRSLINIFQEHSGHLPPSGAGECCEPKLLHYAFTHGLRPVVMAMFWWGESPEGEVRHHRRYYPACQTKCRPLLSWMLRDVPVDDNPLERFTVKVLTLVYEDDDIAVVNKPEGLLTIPGCCNAPSVYSLLRRRWPDADSPIVVHRLDMDTSGLLVVGKTREAHRHLSLQFERRETEKVYVALLERPLADTEGTVSLPLRKNPDDSPRQMVDWQDGKPSLTRYRLLATENGHARLELHPLTGRTHQLRMHCAHREGLSNPILGDRLYGRPDRRLYLHAMRLTITHPVTGRRMTFEQPPDF